MNTIKLENYRCYEHLTLSFKRKPNLLIGDNSSGKTTIIRAVRSVLSTFFKGYSDEHTRFVGLNKDDFTILESETGLQNQNPITIHFELLGQSAQLVLTTKKTDLKKSLMSPIKDYAKNLQETLFDKDVQVKSLPLFASFSTEDIHSNRKLSMSPFKQYAHKPSFGYYECLQGDGFFPYWTKRMLVLKEGGKGIIELKCVQQAIQNALGEDGCNIINDIDIRHNQSKVYYHFTDGREIDSNNLSDGYKRLANMVTDLAFRCALLNQGIYGEKACLKTEGTVLIDEIDLHLHPTLQAVVIKGLQRAFPKLQFIITSHAPMVMTSIPTDQENKIIKLEFNPKIGYSAKEIETRESLLAGQGYICAYCMREIPTKDKGVKETSKIEHVKSRDDRDDLQLEYDNMVICCPGYINSEKHCDKLKGKHSVTFSMLTDILPDSISYSSRNGEIKSSNTTWNKEIKELLNLNNSMLAANRMNTLDGVHQVLEKKKWRKAKLQEKLEEWSNPDAKGKLKPYCGIVIWYLQKKLRQHP